MVASSEVTAHQFPFTDADFNVIAKRAYDDFGLYLQPSKKELVYSRLTKRLRVLKLNDFTKYCDIINNKDANTERMEMLSALTTNVTHFFREPHHFELLRKVILPPLVERAKAGQPIRIWSAGCSAGQEPYSIAAALLDVFPNAAKHDCKILATDVDPSILMCAKQGQYRSQDIDGMDSSNIKKIFKATINSFEKYEILPSIRELVYFGEINLVGSWPIKKKFQTIFCRNVAIYFDKSTQSNLWNRFANQLDDGGYLMIGHSERLNGPAVKVLKNVGVTAFKRST